MKSEAVGDKIEGFGKRLAAVREGGRLSAGEQHQLIEQLHHLLEELRQQSRELEAARLEVEEQRNRHRELLEAGVAERTAQLEAASRAKDEFLAALSHELRTPLNPVLMAAMALEADADLPAEVRRSLEMIRRNVELEARLIDDLLDLTRVAKGKLHLNLQTVDLHELIGLVTDMCRGDIAAGELELNVELQAHCAQVRADPARLQQVLWNLVKNAIKFNQAGGKLIIRSRNPAPDRLQVAVSDTGIGIEQALLPRVFDAFEQGEQTVSASAGESRVSASRRSGGLGLGLAIAKALMEAHGGTLTATSGGRDKGATFALEMQTSANWSADIHIPPLPVPREVQRQKPLKILLVEDHEDTLRVMTSLLRGLGHDVVTAMNLATARQNILGDGFDLLISDIGLPDGSGLSLLQELASGRPFRGIALSGFGSDTDVSRSREAGFVQHLVKPVNLQDLKDAIRQAMAAK